MAAAAVLAVSAPVVYSLQAQADEHAAPAADAAMEMKEMTMADGTKVHVKGDDVFVVGADGAETPAADGEHTMSDVTKVKTIGGKMVHE
mgnify:FL=1